LFIRASLLMLRLAGHITLEMREMYGNVRVLSIDGRIILQVMLEKQMCDVVGFCNGLRILVVQQRDVCEQFRITFMS
jgi:hypothetical protein